MKSEVKKAWVRKLRSGTIDQTSGALNDGAGAMCCLGVLCDIHSKKAYDGLTWKEGKGFDAGLAYGTSAKKDTYAPKRVLTWAGLHHTTALRLAAMNDDGKSFEEIANYIEKNL